MTVARAVPPDVLPVDLGPGVRAGFTVARPGADPPNLSLTVGDVVAAAEHRAGLDRWAGGSVAFVHQVHGAHVHLAEVPTRDPRPAADGVVSTTGVAVGVLVADCVPVLLADPVARVVGAVHAGRRGVVAGVVPATVAAMTQAGARADRVRAVVGPAICGACYEVPAELQAEVGAAARSAVSTTSWGTPALDLPRAVIDQLGSAGVREVARVGGCTLEDARWFSHRGTAAGRPVGRLAAVVVVAPVDQTGRVLPGERADQG